MTSDGLAVLAAAAEVVAAKDLHSNEHDPVPLVAIPEPNPEPKRDFGTGKLGAEVALMLHIIGSWIIGCLKT